MTRNIESPLETAKLFFKSLGKITLIGGALLIGTSIASEFTKNKVAKKYLDAASGVSTIICLGGAYKNRKVYEDYLKLDNSGFKNKYFDK